MSFSCTYGDTRHRIQTPQRRQAAKREKQCSMKELCRKIRHGSFPPTAFFMTGDLNHRNTGGATYDNGMIRMNEGGGQELERKDQKA